MKLVGTPQYAPGINASALAFMQLGAHWYFQFTNFPTVVKNESVVSVCFWIYPYPNTSVRYPIFGNRTPDGSGHWQIEYDQGTATNNIAMSGSGTWVAVTGDNTVPYLTWTHVAFVKKGNGADDTLVYLNGVPATLIAHAAYTISPTETVFRFNGHANTPATLDDFLLFDHELSSNDVVRIYNWRQ